MGFLAKNQEYLKNTAIIWESENENDAQYEKKDGHYLARRNGVSCFIQSKYSVAGELESMFALTPKNAEYILLFGAGSLEAVRYALDKRNFPELIGLTIVEPSPAWFSLILAEVDLENIIGENKFKIAFYIGRNIHQIGNLLSKSIAVLPEKFSFVCHLSVRSLFQEYYSGLLADIIDSLRNIPVFLQTNKSLSENVIYNELLNIAQSIYEFEDVMAVFKDKAVIIVSAGTSLQKNIHLLNEAKEKAVLVAVGSAIRILDARGITPHFQVGIDPMPEMHTIFGSLKTENVPMIFTPTLYSEVLRHRSGVCIAACINERFSAFLHREQNLKQTFFRTGPTVANIAAELFCAAGIKKLIFTGQDMCMYGYQLYADSGEYTGFKNIHQEESQANEYRHMLHLKDIYGTDVIAPRNYYLIKEFLEHTVALYKDKIEFINATEGGLGIEGAANETLAAVLASLPQDDIGPVLAKKLEETKQIDFYSAIYQFKEDIDTIEKLNNENIENLEKIKKILSQDKDLANQQKYIKAFKNAGINERKMKEIKIHKVIQQSLELYLETDCMRWGQGIDSPDLKVRYKSILEIQLLTAHAAKRFLRTIKLAFEEAFAEKIKVKTCSLVIK